MALKRSRFGELPAIIAHREITSGGTGLIVWLVLARLQLQGELQSKQAAPRLYKGVFHGMNVILKNEGIKGLLRGISCAVRKPGLATSI